MTKKIILTLFLFLTIFLYKPDISLAACVQKSSRSCPAGNGIGCTVNSGQYCCATTQDCTDLKSNDPSDPTAGCTNTESINSAIGCIPVGTTNAFMGWILGWAVGVGGGIAFLLIVYASFMVMTSQGDPTRLKAGQELLTSAISGLIMLIFSVFILKFIGVDILGLGSFGFGN